MTPGPGISRTPLPKGFTAAGINSGVRRYRPDLGIIISDRECVASGVFTQNECKAAPVKYSQALLPSKHIRAIITNSGQANAATGELGRENNWKMAKATAAHLGCVPHQILTASTGVIGVQLEIEKIVASLPQLFEKTSEIAENFALAILTTDLVPKTVTTTVKLSGGETRITGICKGSGMIHPNMATMLGYLLTDVSMSLDLAADFVKEATDQSFNMISVDGDTSTNDCVYLLANGASEVAIATDEDKAIFKKALIGVAQLLAQSIARDGEGADKLITVNVKNAPNRTVARDGARAVVTSPLFKAAIHGEDPNWGRVLAKLGAAQVPGESLEQMNLEIQGVKIFSNGAPISFDRFQVKQLLKSDTVVVDIDLCSGSELATAWGCDLSKRYVEINAEYN